MSLLDDLLRAGALRTFDHALAQSLRRLDMQGIGGLGTSGSGAGALATGEATPDAVLAAAALASLAVGHGHAGIDLTRPQLLFDGPIDWPQAQGWREALAASRWVSTPGAEAVAPTGAPLVLEGDLLYLRRYREYERRLASGLRRIAGHAAGHAAAPVDSAALAPVFATLFPHADTDVRMQTHTGDMQARAAALALLRPLLLVSGGPGTGKTTTIARTLLLLIAGAHASGGPLPRIALAAPTGRAADRMADSLRRAVAPLRDMPGIQTRWLDALPTGASTLHRLLGTIPDSPQFRHHADNPLPFDVVVVDEASMVDLPLMCKLVEAVTAGAQLILLGDPDQLPSVEAGDVLAAIVEAAGADAALPPELLPLFAHGETAPAGAVSAASAVLPNANEATGSRLEPLLQRPRELRHDERGQTSFLSGHRVHLRRGYRQSETLDLAPLAAVARAGDADAMLELLRGGTLAGVHFHEGLLDPLSGVALSGTEQSATERPGTVQTAPPREALLACWRAIAAAPDARAALDMAGRVRLLTALRDGPQGAHSLNARIEEALAGAHRLSYFPGRLLLITENNYRHQLFNGDIGVCRRDDSGATVAWFAGGSDGERGFHPAALPAHTGAFAMTVHKAQGSEFDSVWLQLPRHDVRTLSRELVYTALTRARNELHVCASDSVLRAALSRHAARVSGLGWRLRNDIV